MPPIEADVVIAGGGIMGCSTALHLRLRGRSVVLLERDTVAAHASGVNFGNVRRQRRFLPQLPLAMRSREIWGRLADLVGDTCEFTPAGHVVFAFDEGDMAALETYAMRALEYGLELEILGANAVCERWPWVGDGIIGGSWSPNDGHANPRLLAPAFARRARAIGAQILEGATVVEARHDGARFRVATDDGREIAAPVMVNASGAWADTLSAWFGEPVSLVPEAPQQGVTEPLPPLIGPTVGTLAGDIYLRQVARGNVVFGGGRGIADAAARRVYTRPQRTLTHFTLIRRLVPALGHARLIRTWAGIEGYMPDDIPVIGPSRTTPGLFHAFGFCGHGFQLGPGVGSVLAELIVDGHSDVPLEPFHIARFAA